MEKIEVKISDENWAEFEKLYKVSIPVKSDANYYLGLLAQSGNYHVQEQLKAFKEVIAMRQDVGKFKMEKMQEMVNYLNASQTYKNLLGKEMILSRPTKDELKKTLIEKPNTIFISIDLAHANYSAMKRFEVDDELGLGWVDFCSRFDLPAAFALSKSFRQMVFGNVNPKLLQKVQHEMVNELLSHLGGYNIVRIAHDEIILAVEDDAALSKASWHLYELNEQVFTSVVHIDYYRLKPIGKDMFVKIFTDKAFDKELVGVPGNQFYQYYKTEILNQSVEEKDLYFMVDGKLAKWVI